MYQSLFIYLLKGHLSCFQILTTVNSPGQSTGEDSCSLLQGNLPNPGIEPRSPMFQVDYLPCEPPGKPKIKNMM